MSRPSRILAPAFIAGLFATAAAAQETPVTAHLTVRTSGNVITSSVVTGLVSADECLRLGWLNSLGAEQWNGKETIVVCLKNGSITNAQSCSGGTCQPMGLPRP